MMDYKNIKHLFFDIDGVFTNNEILITEEGELLRSMNVKDGYAVKRALQAGYDIVVITGGNSEGVKKRLAGLGIANIYSGIQNKISTFEEVLALKGWKPNNVLYMGDDIPDLECMKAAGIGICPADAVAEVKDIADHVSSKAGGSGCVRELIEDLLTCNNQWP